MKARELVHKWFECWESNNFLNIPVTDDFTHTSPYGVISGKNEYLKIVEQNRDKFLNHKFIILDELFDDQVACVRYKAVQPEFELEVTEWHKVRENKISEIIAYYNIPGEVRSDRKITGLDKSAT